jgi:hypothetical protein
LAFEPERGCGFGPDRAGWQTEPEPIQRLAETVCEPKKTDLFLTFPSLFFPFFVILLAMKNLNGFSGFAKT